MALKLTVKTLDDVPEQFRSLYVKVGDEFVLDTDDGGYKKKLSEFRDTNIELRTQLEQGATTAEELTALQVKFKTFEGMDAEAAREALEQMQAMKDKKLIDAGKIDELLADRTERMRADYDSQVTAALTARDAAIKKESVATGKLSAVVIDNAIQSNVSGVATVRKGAMFDILNRAREVWKLDDNGTPVPYKGDGTVMYGKDGENALTMGEWAQGLRAECGYLFEGNAGGGAGGNDDEHGNVTIVNRGDTDAMSNNLEGIAAGTVRVAQ
jgi:hypothetical protein